MIVEVESNPNCSLEIYQRFKEVDAPRVVRRVRIYDRTDAGEWCAVTGWSDEAGGAPCPAWCQRVEDSGAGSTLLIYGARYGIRLRPEGIDGIWTLADGRQWGEPYLAIASEADVEFE